MQERNLYPLILVLVALVCILGTIVYMKQGESLVECNCDNTEIVNVVRKLESEVSSLKTNRLGKPIGSPVGSPE